MKYKNEIGNRYGKLLVVEKANNTLSGIARWRCKCDCGKESIVIGSSLRNGTSKSCGCSTGVKRTGLTIYKRLFRLTKYHCLKNSVPFELSLDDYKNLLLQKCNYCGRDPYSIKYGYHRLSYSKGKQFDETIKLNGIDQILPSKGYTKDNVVTCCKYCNRAKSDLSIEEFKNLIILLYNNLINNGK